MSREPCTYTFVAAGPQLTIRDLRRLADIAESLHVPADAVITSIIPFFGPTRDAPYENRPGINILYLPTPGT